jgi:hypothetical protein
MACCSESGGKKGGGGCCGDRPFPWLSALTDRTIAKLFFRRFWRELLIGLGAGCMTSLALLGLGDTLGGLLRLPLHFQAPAVWATVLPGGLILSLGLAGKGNWTGPAIAVLVCALLGGIGNGLLAVGEPERGLLAAFLENGGPASILAFGLLLPPALAGSRWLLALGLKAPEASNCHSQEAP